MAPLLLKLTLTPVLIGGASLAARRWDRPRAAGSSPCRSPPGRLLCTWPWTGAPSLPRARPRARSVDCSATRPSPSPTAGWLDGSADLLPSWAGLRASPRPHWPSSRSWGRRPCWSSRSWPSRWRCSCGSRHPPWRPAIRGRSRVGHTSAHGRGHVDRSGDHAGCWGDDRARTVRLRRRSPPGWWPSRPYNRSRFGCPAQADSGQPRPPDAGRDAPDPAGAAQKIRGGQRRPSFRAPAQGLLTRHAYWYA